MSKYVGKNNAPMSLSDMLKQVTEGLHSQAEKPNLYAYEPNPKQAIFHPDERFGRIYIGGNQCGKTTGSVVEAIWWATKKHPYRKFKTKGPIHGRVVVVDFLEGMEKIVLPEFQRWIPPIELKNQSWLDSWDNYRRTLTFANGSTIEFLSYEQDLEKHAGTKRNFVYFDEEPPESIFGENMARLLAQEDAGWWCAMTPMKGITWMGDRFIEPPEERQADVASRTLVLWVDTTDNEKNLPAGTVERTLSDLSEDEQKVRKHGAYIPRGGKVYPEFQATIHGTIPKEWMPPKTWTIWMSIDSGWTNPTAVEYTAVSPTQDEVVTFHEFVEKGLRVDQWAAMMKQFEQENGLHVYNRIGDPAMNQVKENTGISIIAEYAKHGIYIATNGGSTTEAQVKLGVEKVKQYLRPNPRRNNHPFWQISQPRCPVLVDQMKKLQWDYIQSEKLRSQTNAPEKIKKLHDHAPDAMRYLFANFPDLTDNQIAGEVPIDFDPNSYVNTLVAMATRPAYAAAPVGSKRTSNDWEEENFSDDDAENWF